MLTGKVKAHIRVVRAREAVRIAQIMVDKADFVEYKAPVDLPTAKSALTRESLELAKAIQSLQQEQSC